jgi:hypothetical protein
MGQTHVHPNHPNNQEETVASHLIIGKYYDIVVFSCFLLSLFEVYTFVNSSSLEGKAKYLTRMLAIVLEFSTGLLYTAHFFAIVKFILFI